MASQRQLAGDLFGAALVQAQRGKAADMGEYEKRKWWKGMILDEAQPLQHLLAAREQDDKQDKDMVADAVVPLSTTVPVGLFTIADQEHLEALFNSVLEEHTVSHTVSLDQMDGPNKHAKLPGGSNHQRYFVKPAERPFARLASVISKFPWHAVHPVPEEVDRLFSCLQRKPSLACFLARSVKYVRELKLCLAIFNTVAVKTVYSMKEDMPFAHDICAMLVRAGLNCPGRPYSPSTLAGRLMI